MRQTVKPVPKPRTVPQKELTSREKAIEFSKNVPKPKVRPLIQNGEEGLNQINEEEFDEMGITIGMHETNRDQMQ